jgi:queuine tRNA-ribosyltransferase
LSHFKLIKTCPNSQARAGELTTSHGMVPTPVFMPVGSQATVKTLITEELQSLGALIILSNTYHLYLRPGADIIADMGGLHRFMAWPGPILTDSGGYQLFSLAPLCQVNEEGVNFRSHIDGSIHFLSPEQVVALQEKLGADIIMTLDQCPAYGDNLEMVRSATDRSHRWAERCRKAHTRQDQFLYPIVQGGTFTELRRDSARTLASLDFPGYGIGGLSLGEGKSVMLTMLEETLAELPQDKPRYLMGVGSPEDLVAGVARGVDLFDCALPTRVARTGALYTRQGRRNIRNASWQRYDGPIDQGCDCYTCRTFSGAYLHHLFKAEELLAYRLATIHNLRFIIRLMTEMRQAIIEDRFNSFSQEFLDIYKPTDEEVRVEQKQKWLKNRREKANSSE